MKHNISLRLRVTLITASVMTIICLILSFFILRNVDMKIAMSIDPQENSQSETMSEGARPVEFDTVEITSVNLDDFYRTSVLLVAAVLIPGIIAIYFIIWFSLKPIEKLQKKIAKIDGADMSKRIDDFTGCTELNALSASFNQLLDRLEDAFVREKNFSAGAAHELKTPLAIIKTNLDVLALSESPTDEEYFETVSVVKNQVARMSKLIDDLFAMYSSSGYEMKEIVDVERLIWEIVIEQQPLAEEREITISRQSVACDARANSVMLKHALSNLVQNAVKYNVPKGTIDITVQTKENHCVIAVTDTGIGISEAAAEHIFEPFYREDKSRSRKMGGAGLGLSIAKRIISEHGGTLVYAPNEPKGSVFTVTLPI